MSPVSSYGSSDTGSAFSQHSFATEDDENQSVSQHKETTQTNHPTADTLIQPSVCATKQEWNSWLLRNRQYFSSMVWNFLVYSECVDISAEEIVLGLPEKYIEGASMSVQKKIRRQINRLLPSPLIITLEKKTHPSEKTLHQQLKAQLLDSVRGNKYLIDMQQRFGFQLDTDRTKIY